MTDERVPGRERVVGARACETEREDMGRLDPHQAFLEIGGLLLGHMDEAPGRDQGAGGRRHRIEIANHAIGNAAGPDRLIGATIGRYQKRREPERRVERILAEGAGAHERDWQGRLDNLGYHGRIDDD